MATNPFAEGYPGACISCGFLGQISTLQPGLHEIKAAQRATGRLPTHNALWCLRRAKNLAEEMHDEETTIRNTGTFEGHDADQPRILAMRNILQRGPACPEWFEWVEYFTPKEHFEMWQMLELEKLRQAQAKMIADVELKMAEEQTKIAAEHAKTAAAHKAIFERADRQTGLFNRFFLILALAALFLAIAALAYPNGITWVVDHAPGAVEQGQPVIPIPSQTP